MQRKSLFAALLLPVPFAALPLAALLFTHVDSTPAIIVRQDAAATFRIGPGLQVSPLTLNVADSPHKGCPDKSTPPIEG
jgi:hypothetical protein